jgi:His-Xaa-Ser system radical SAM maturase HxsB
MKMERKASHELGFFRAREVAGNKVFLSCEHGSWIILSKNEYEDIISGIIDDKLKTELSNVGIINAKENMDKFIEDYRKRYFYLYQGPSLHIVVVTKQCNLKCRYCQASAKMEKDSSNHMSMKTARKTVDFILKGPSKNIIIEFQGGEPLLNFDVIKYIVEYAKESNKDPERNIDFSIVTNLTLMDDDKLQFFIDHKIGVCSSFEGIKEVHDKVRVFRSGEGSYENVVKWIKKINSIQTGKVLDPNKRYLNTLLTITRYSLPYYKEIIDQYIRFGFSAIHLRFMNNLGYASEEWEELGYTAEEFLDFWKKSVDYIVKKNLEGTYIFERFVQIIMQKLFTDTDPAYTEMMNPCGAVLCQLAYNVDGGVYSCDEGRMVSEDIFKLGTVDDEYKEVVSSPRACSLMSSSVLDTLHCSTCAYKPFCGVCPVMNYMEKGTTITNVAESSRCKIHMGMFDYIIEKVESDEDYKKVFMSWINPRSVGK